MIGDAQHHLQLPPRFEAIRREALDMQGSDKRVVRLTTATADGPVLSTHQQRYGSLVTRRSRSLSHTARRIKDSGNGDLVSVMGMGHAPRPPRRGTPATFYYPLPDIPRSVFDSLWAGETLSHGWLGVHIKDVDAASATELGLEHIAGTVVMSIHRPAGKETALRAILG